MRHAPTAQVDQTIQNPPVSAPLDMSRYMPGLSRAGQALTLERAWRLARENDPSYQAALSRLAAARTQIRQGRSAILPHVQAGYSRSKVSGLRRLYASGLMRENDLNYDSTSAYIQLVQPIFSVESYARFQGGKARSDLGEAEFFLDESEAALRLADTYLDAVAAQGALALVQALADSLEQQAAIQDALFELDAATRVDAQETRARLARARADVIVATDDLAMARHELSALISVDLLPPVKLDALDGDYLQIQQPLSHWLERALAHGAVVRAAKARVDVADTEVRIAQGRHVPTVSLAVGLSDADNEDLGSLSQRTNVFTVGLQVAIPIYSGGYDTANHARSRYERRQAGQELTQVREHVAAEVMRHYTTVQGSVKRIAALGSAVRSGEESLKAARYGYEYGFNSNLDVLRSQDSLFYARHELLMARVDWLRARVALAAATGASLVGVFIDMDRTVHTGLSQRANLSLHPAQQGVQSGITDAPTP